VDFAQHGHQRFDERLAVGSELVHHPRVLRKLLREP
jgi:hypothetical protein